MKNPNECIQCRPSFPFRVSNNKKAISIKSLSFVANRQIFEAGKNLKMIFFYLSFSIVQDQQWREKQRFMTFCWNSHYRIDFQPILFTIKYRGKTNQNRLKPVKTGFNPESFIPYWKICGCGVLPASKILTFLRSIFSSFLLCNDLKFKKKMFWVFESTIFRKMSTSLGDK